MCTSLFAICFVFVPCLPGNKKLFFVLVDSKYKDVLATHTYKVRCWVLNYVKPHVIISRVWVIETQIVRFFWLNCWFWVPCGLCNPPFLLCSQNQLVTSSTMQFLVHLVNNNRLKVHCSTTFAMLLDLQAPTYLPPTTLSRSLRSPLNIIISTIWYITVIVRSHST